ncbi:MAG TPA: cation:proton antiporter [Rubrobacteraceae bacterium]|nr:cation:proton antiporter [Rubrobacteraceae bacterium]
MPDLITGFALVAVVLVVAGLTSGFVERAPLSFPIIFLGLGFLIGGHGLGVLEIGVEDPVLETVATLTLALVLCLEGMRIGNESMEGAGAVPVLSLGPGTIIIISVVASGSHFLLGTSLVESLLLGTILASTDPVVLRDVVRDERIPRSVRQALNIEAGTNDIVVLPILLVLIAVANAEATGAAGWALFAAQILLLGPAVGFAIGTGAAWLMSRADERYAISEVYQSLYGIGIILAAFSTAQALGGDGFLAAFAAGFAIAILNFDLCECFLNYGETTAEMAMLLSFILFGVVVSDLFVEVPLVPALLLSAIVLFIARPLAIGLVLRKAAVSNAARWFIGWFGPRGLNSLLLALLLIHASVPGAEFLLAVVGFVVTVSVVLHGASATPLSTIYARAVDADTHEEEREGSSGGIFSGAATGAARVSPEELAAMLESGDPPLVLDVRTRSQFERDGRRIPGALRVRSDEVEEWARSRQDEHRGSQVEGQRIVAYCT